MEKLLYPICLLPFFLLGCGGGKDSPPVVTHTTSSSVVSSSQSSTTSLSASSLLSSSKASSILSSSNASSSVDAVSFTLGSNSFVSGETAPVKLTCDGGEVSPNLYWEITDDRVKGFALVMEDTDAIALVGYPYVHWNIYNIAADVRHIPEGATITSAMPSGSVEGTNSDGVAKYSGPCPPAGTGNHHYFFALYALNKESITVNLGRSLNRTEFESMFMSDIVKKVEINTNYGL